MATKAKQAKAPAKKPAAKAAKSAKPGAAAPGGNKKKGVIILAVAALVLIGLAAQGYFLARRQVSQNVEMLQRGPIVTSNIPSTRWLFGDKEGNFIRLNGMNEVWQIRKYNNALQMLAEYKPKKAAENFVHARSGTVDEEGNVYFLQSNGVIKVLDKDLVFQRNIETRLNDTTSIDIDNQGRLWVVCRTDGMIVLFDKQGQRLTEIGAPGSATGTLSNPTLVVISPALNTAYVMEPIPAGLRIKAIDPDSFKVSKSFIVPEDKVRYFEHTGMAVDPQGRIFFNDHLGGNAVVIYDALKGKFIGTCKGTDTGQQIVAPGSLGGNRYNGDIFVDFIPGVMRIAMPEPK